MGMLAAERGGDGVRLMWCEWLGIVVMVVLVAGCGSVGEEGGGVRVNQF